MIRVAVRTGVEKTHLHNYISYQKRNIILEAHKTKQWLSKM